TEPRGGNEYQPVRGVGRSGEGFGTRYCPVLRRTESASGPPGLRQDSETARWRAPSGRGRVGLRGFSRGREACYLRKRCKAGWPLLRESGRELVWPSPRNTRGSAPSWSWQAATLDIWSRLLGNCGRSTAALKC